MAIPTIDISSFLREPSSTSSPHQISDPSISATSDSRQRNEEILSQIRAASLDKGLFILTGHGIPRTLQQRVLTQSRRFFDLPLSEKLELAETKSFGKSHRGYQVFGGEAYEEGKLPDLKEGFQIGVEKPLDHPDCVSKRMLTGPNVWPASLEPEFSASMLEYAEALHKLSVRLVEMLAQTLNVNFERHFGHFCRDSLQAVRLLHYPPMSEGADPQRQLGTGAHTDFGLVTLLLTDGVAGLQAFDEKRKDEVDGGWVNIEAETGDYIVNLGDIFTRLTAGVYKSPLHRVLNVGDRHRYSIPYFLDGNLDAVVRSLIDGPGGESGDMTVEEHMTERFKSARDRAKEEAKRVRGGGGVVPAVA